MKNKQTINRLFAAVCGSQIVKGGGGGGVPALKNACLRGFLAVFAVVFSAGFNISANAQQVGVDMPPSADVYQRPTYIRSFGANTIDYGDTLINIIDMFRIASGGSDYSIINLGSALERINDSDGNNGLAVNENMLGPNGLLLYPVNNGREMAPGDRFRINHHTFVSAAAITAYMYTATGGEFAFAENTGNPAATTGTGEFFLDTNFAETTEITAAMGFTEVQCLPNYVRQPDMTTCRAIAAADCGQNGRPDFWDGSMCVADCGPGFTNPAVGETCRAEVQDPQTGNNNPQTQKSDGKNHTGALIFGGLMIMGAIGYAIDGDVSPFSFAPDFGYRITESGYAANAGGRIDFRKDNWHLYQFATQTNKNGNFADFRYTSGGHYKGDLFAAAFSETVQGETADYDLSLSADFRGGIWKISPVYRLHSRFDKDETETNNSLNLESVLQINRWMITPSAGFRWENTNGFTENARFRIDAVHRF